MADDTKNLTARQRILQAAARVYLRRGPASTIEEIAAESDYSPAALYKHFSGKEAIFEALAHELGEAFAAMFEEAPPVELSFEQHLKWVLYRTVAFAENQRDMFVASVMSSAWTFGGSGSSTALRENRARIRAGFLAIMQKGIDEGQLRELPAELYVMAFGGALQALHFEWVEAPFELAPRIDELFDLFMRGARA